MRQTKKNNQFYHCLKISLTAYITANIIAESTNYHTCSNSCREVLFKVILRKAIIDTRDAVSNMSKNLSSLDTYIKTVN